MGGAHQECKLFFIRIRMVVFFAGTGSGIGTKVLELLQDGYPEVYR